MVFKLMLFVMRESLFETFLLSTYSLSSYCRDRYVVTSISKLAVNGEIIYRFNMKVAWPVVRKLYL